MRYSILGSVIGIFALTTMGAMSEHFNFLFNFAEEWYSSSIPVGSPDGQAALLPFSGYVSRQWAGSREGGWQQRYGRPC